MKPKPAPPKKLKLTVDRLKVLTGLRVGLCAGGDYSTTPDHSVIQAELAG
jgi:hypothetical protein